MIVNLYILPPCAPDGILHLAGLDQAGISIEGTGVHRMYGEWVARVVFEKDQLACGARDPAYFLKPMVVFILRDMMKDTSCEHKIERVVRQGNRMAANVAVFLVSRIPILRLIQAFF